MTREKAEKIARGIIDKIECNTADIDDWAEFWGFTREEYEEFLDMAIKVPEPSGDLISRQAVIDITWEEPSYTDALNVLTEVRDKVKALPSVKPQEKMGKWISDSESYGYGKDDYHCSICGRTIHLCRPLEQLTDYPYCHCGAKMN